MEKNTELLPDFVLCGLRDMIRNTELTSSFLLNNSGERIENKCDEIINKMLPDDIFKEWLEWEGIINYDNKIRKAIEGIYQVPLVREHEKTWCMWNLSEGDIVGVAKKCGESLIGVDFDGVARIFKKKLEVAVEDVWEDALEDAIKEQKEFEEKLISQHENAVGEKLIRDGVLNQEQVDKVKKLPLPKE